jgi:type I restriction-modification system DNA methylase subunit
MPVPEIIKELVDRFEQHRDSYHSGKYNEAQLRREFLDPFLEALGWDVFNKKGYAEAYKDVIHEDSLDVEGENKAPDYAFRIGGTRKFFVEAKKPSVRIETDIHPAFQLRRYAWSAKLPLSILTDFEEFAVYDCRAKPDKTDKASTGRVMLLSYKDYVEKWDEIAAIFSREAVLKGSFDGYAEGLKGKKGTAEVDDAFLAEIERWRELLAKNIALRNPSLTVRELNYAVQMTIDRIVFLRICEDRGVERDEQLKEIANGKDVYKNLCQLFQRADTRYNSGLFHFKKEKEQSSPADSLTLGLQIDDKVLQDILKNLYYPESPYVFREIPSDILGQVYERFLGKVIRLTAGHQAKVEEKPEVRKAGGVYYTPTYIVNYIVQNTVGKLLEGKTPREAAKLRILDPACGSGTFPLGAYQYLLDWHLKWYGEHNPEKLASGKDPVIYQGKGGAWMLTTAEKKRILLNNIFGVDIDAQAVEVTKLSLLLKVLEGESNETIGSQLALFQERVLPDLSKNVQCGNSLIGSDYFEGSMFVEQEERERVNAFDWKSAFPQVFSQGGFDVVIGNPPYIRIQALQETSPINIEFYKKKYKAAIKGNYDIYVIFIEKVLSLLNQTGRMGFILPSKFFATDYGESIRQLITEKKALSQIVDFGHLQIFEQATTYTCLLFLTRVSQSTFDYAKVNFPNELKDASFRTVQNSLTADPWVFSDDITQKLVEKINSISKPLSNLPTRIGRGSSSGADDVFMLRKEGNNLFTRQGNKVIVESEILREPTYATDFGRYEFRPAQEEVIIFPYKVNSDGYELIEEDKFKRQYPKAYEYLLSRKKELLERKQFKQWFGFSAPRNLEVHETAQILVPLLADRGLYCRLSDDSSHYCLMASGGFSITVSKESGLSPNFVLGLLNSRLLFWRLRSISNVFRGGWITCTKQYVETLPIRSINFSDSADKAHHDKMVSLVERMLELHKRSPRTPQEKESLQREIESTDRAIDKLVYELYGLTEEEIRIVEGKP